MQYQTQIANELSPFFTAIFDEVAMSASFITDISLDQGVVRSVDSHKMMKAVMNWIGFKAWNRYSRIMQLIRARPKLKNYNETA